MPEITIDAAEIKERKADSKGRVAIGPDHAGDTIRVALVEVVDEQSDS